MLEFSKEFFQREVRSEFAVGEVMKRAWAAQLEVLAEIMRVSEKYDLTCYVYWGSLLGTVRHQGFIPWDDDVDIAFVGEDYIKFLEVAEKELPKEYDIRNVYTRSDWGEDFTRINNNTDINITQEYMERNHGFPLIVGIDVFPLYYLPRNEEWAEQQKLLLDKIFMTIGLVLYQEELNQEAGMVAEKEEITWQITESIVELQQITGFELCDQITLKTQLFQLFDQVGRLYTAAESDEVTYFWQYVQNGYSVKKELFEKVIKMPFENLTVNVPGGYDEILRKTFKDYRIIKKYKTHEYPFFKEEALVLGRQLEILDLQYKLGSDNIDVRIAPDSAKETISAENAERILPKVWWEKIYPLSESGERKKKKVVLFYASIGSILSASENVIAKLRYVINTFQNNSDIVLWWFTSGVDKDYFPFVQIQVENLLKEYREIVVEYQEQNIGIYDETGDISRAIAMCDAYYGDDGVIADCVAKTGKLMMYQNYEIT